MAGLARKLVFDPDEVGVYHCTSECVQQFWLCGCDPVLQQDYSHRKDWIEQRTEELLRVFAFDLLSVSLLEGHLHHVLRNRPDLARSWSLEEVARRWWRVHPWTRRRGQTPPPELPPEELERVLRQPERLEEYRRRLMDLSWLMKDLKENIAKRANQEMGTRGHFWAGRFHCRRLLDEAAVLVAAVYADLNPVRAGIAPTPETSRYTSVYHRIVALRERRAGRAKPSGLAADRWLAPVPAGGEPGNLAAPVYRASDQGFLELPTVVYLHLVDRTGRQLRRGKRGRIDPELPPILERLGIRAAGWLEAVERFPERLGRFVGRPEQLAEVARRLGRRWLHGQARCRELFH